MPGLPATAVQDKKFFHLKDANTEVFTLGWYPTFIQKKKTELGSIMNQIGYARYDKQWWDDFRSKLYDCKNKRNDLRLKGLFRWENL